MSATIMAVLSRAEQDKLRRLRKKAVKALATMSIAEADEIGILNRKHFSKKQLAFMRRNGGK